MENGKYVFERTILGAGAAIVKAIAGQQSSENPHQPSLNKTRSDPDILQNR
jgi:hypothetical protein